MERLGQKSKVKGWLSWSKSTFDKQANLWYRNLKLGPRKDKNVQGSQNSLDNPWNEILEGYKYFLIFNLKYFQKSEVETKKNNK